MRPNVLFIDDEPNNLISFKASFRKHFQIFTASSASEGMKVLDEEQIHVLLTDQRMPGTTGVQFLEQVIAKYPDPIRILVTGYSDIEAVVDAINKGQVFRYISKPWKEEELIYAINSAFRIYQHREEQNFFVYKASHDLKGPLVSIKGLIDLIKKEHEDNQAVSQYIDLIDDSVQHLDVTLSELIEFKKIGEAQVKPVDVDFEFMIREILNGFSRYEKYPENEINVNVEQYDTFRTDRTILKSILANIIQNAVKYGRYSNNKPKIDISVKLEDKVSYLEIKDNGIGMPEAVQKNIFKMFYRGISEIKGTGLGLYIVKTGLDKIGGTIKVESEEKVGSTFKVVLPELSDVVIPNR